MKRLSLLIPAFLTIIRLFAQPANDEICDAAFILPSHSYTPHAFDNIGATGSFNDGLCYAEQDQDVWFKTIVPANGALHVYVESDTLTKMIMMIYTTDSCDGNLSLLDCSYGTGSLGLPNMMLSGLPIGEEIYIRLFDYYYQPPFFQPDPYEYGTFEISIENIYFNSPNPLGNCNSISAGDDCASAAQICSIVGYCGSTSGYTDQAWSGLETPFCGSIENNSFLKFNASSDSISLSIDVTGSPNDCPTGIQFFVFSMTNCGDVVVPIACQSPLNIGSTDFNFSGLTIGQEYYVMIDGYAGDVCDYSIEINDGNSPTFGIYSSPTVCLGDTIRLGTDTIGSGTIIWSGPNIVSTTGNKALALPSSPGTYTFVAEAQGYTPICGDNIDTFVVEVVGSNISTNPIVTQTPCTDTFVVDLSTSSYFNCNWLSSAQLSSSYGQNIEVYTNITEEIIAVVSDTNGCILKDTISIIPDPSMSIDTNVQIINTQLVSNHNNADSYQWLDCNNGQTPIIGGTNQAFQPSTNGNYAVAIESGSCMDTSFCHNFTICIVDTSVISQNEFLVANETAANYQWIDCDNGFLPFINDTNQFFDPPYSGNFAVIIESGACIDTSFCHFHDGCNDLMIQPTNVSHPTPGQADGEIEFIGYGGSPLYNYLWDDGYTDSVRTQLDSGAYQVTITDQNLCSDFRIFYLFDTDTSANTVPPTDTLSSGILDVCIPFSYTNVFIYDYYEEVNGDLIVRWAFVDNQNNVFLQIVNYGAYPISLVSTNLLIELSINCQNGSDNNKQLEVFQASIFINGTNLNAEIDEFTPANIKLYPNPTQDKVTFELNNTVGEYTLQILDSRGRQIQKLVSSKTKGQLELNVEKGIYYFQFQLRNGMVTKKVVKN